MKSYRVKTEKEFIEAYGENWEEETAFGWVEEMNINFGKSLTEEQNKRLESFGSVILTPTTFTVSKKELTQIFTREEVVELFKTFASLGDEPNSAQFKFMDDNI